MGITINRYRKASIVVLVEILLLAGSVCAADGWVRVFTPPGLQPYYLACVSVGSDGQAVAAGLNGSIIVSRDFGQSWTDAPTQIYDHCHTASIRGKDHVLLGTNTSRGLLESTDFCESWSSHFERSVILDMDFTASGFGAFVDSYYSDLYTIDSTGGEWRKCETLQDGEPPVFEPSSVAVFGDSMLAVYGFYHKVKISNSRGKTWKSVKVDRVFWDLAIVNDSTIVASAMSSRDTRPSIIVRSSDGGSTWDSVYSAPGLIHCVHIPKGTYGHAVGERGFILRTNDGGRTWTRQESGGNYNLRDVYVIDSLTSLAVGVDVVLRTTSGGATSMESSHQEITSQFALTVWPNPAESHLNIRIPAVMQFKPLTIKLVSAVGCVFTSSEVAGQQEIHVLDVGDIPSGPYQLTVIGAQTSLTTSVMVVR